MAIAVCQVYEKHIINDVWKLQLWNLFIFVAFNALTACYSLSLCLFAMNPVMSCDEMVNDLGRTDQFAMRK